MGHYNERNLCIISLCTLLSLFNCEEDEKEGSVVMSSCFTPSLFPLCSHMLYHFTSWWLNTWSFSKFFSLNSQQKKLVLMPLRRRRLWSHFHRSTPSFILLYLVVCSTIYKLRMHATHSFCLLKKYVLLHTIIFSFNPQQNNPVLMLQHKQKKKIRTHICCITPCDCLVRLVLVRAFLTKFSTK